MGKVTDTDKAIRNIMRWADRPEWSGEQSAVFEAHLDPLCERIGIGHAELALELEQHGYNGMLFGIMFEDFLSRRLAPDDRNIIDDYLKHRGWRETVPGKRYLQQIRDSVLSLYEVVEVSPGKHCDLRDLVRGRDSESIRVFEHMGTQNMVKWDRLAARVLKSNGRHIFSGGILPFPRDSAESLLRMLADAQHQFDRRLSGVADKETRNKISSSVNKDLFLRNSCPAFTSIWLIYTLKQLNEPLPEMINRDGDALVFTETRFPILAENRARIIERLDAAPEWERDQPDRNTWVWLSEQDAIGNKPQHGLAFETFQGGDLRLNGTLELKAGALSLSSNSAERARRGQAMLETLLHGLVGPALSMLETPEQMMAEHETRQHGDGDREPPDSIDPELAASIIHHYLDQHYRQTLDEPIPALGNKTPRQCAGSKKGREKVIEWLKHLENNEQRRAANQGQAPYDCQWIWEELKLTR
ncbi:MAG TPA: hypothetical protein VMZ32_07145 [Gammaproteobacteria bacterium]|nr:hypothetical protein [Gammaproteobacteria bacterium]